VTATTESVDDPSWGKTMTLEGIDLLDLDRFQRLEHWAMFDRLRQEDPVSWNDYRGALGLCTVLRH
jgi:hypothetical protein